MPAFLRHFRTAWDDYFTTTGPATFNSILYTSRQTPSSSSVYISNCLFGPISSTSGHGGALFCSTSVTYLLIESTSFFSCKTSSGWGGAIYFENSGDGQSVLHTVCGYDCCSTYTSGPYYHFAFIRVYSAASSKNRFNYSSIARCVDVNSNSWYMFYLYSGNLSCPSVNISLNKCRGELNRFYPFIDSNSVTCSFSFTSFVDNISTSSLFIHLNAQGAKYEIKSCNIIRNTQGTLNSHGIIYANGNTMIKDSCILENKATYIFYSISSYAITLSNCTVDTTSNNGYLTTLNTVTKSFILALNHMSTRNCNAEYDSAGTLTPIIQHPSSSKKQIHLCTCGECLYYSSLRDFFLLTCVSFLLKPHP
jgi:hypothetical protein